MTQPCGCGGNLSATCSCVIVPGPGAGVSGTGTPEDPYVITGSAAAVTVADTPTVDMSISGDGAATPYEISSQVRLAGSNLITATDSGLLVACGSVQDCVADAMGPGLTWNAADRRYEVALSTQPGNVITIDDAGGLYASTDGSVQPARPRARVGKATAQEIPTGAVSTVVQLDQPLIDNAGIHTAVGRLTAPVDGGYDLGVQLQWQTTGTNQGHRAVFLRLNGAQLIAGDQRPAEAETSTIQNVSISYDLTAGDYIEIIVQHSHTTAINVLAANGFVPLAWMYLTTEGLG